MVASLLFEAAIIAITFGVIEPALNKPDDGSYTNVQVGVGLTTDLSGDDDPWNYGGDTPSVHLFSELGLSVGSFDGWKKGRIHAGTHKDIKVEHRDKNFNADATYILISQGGNDAICISYFKVTTPNGNAYTIYGDIPAACDAVWYYSSRRVPVGPTGDEVKPPRCFWLDGDAASGDGPTDKIYQGMGMHLPSFRVTDAQLARYEENPDLVCASPARYSNYRKASVFSQQWIFNPPTSQLESDSDGVILDESKIIDKGWAAAWYPPCRPPPNEPIYDQKTVDRFARDCPPYKKYDDAMAAKRKRSNVQARNKPAKAKFMAGALVVSDLVSHSAKEICESGNSKGPDFVSTHERLMCDMDTRELWPFCETPEARECFDLEAKNVRYPAHSLHRRSDEYKKIEHWK